MTTGGRYDWLAGALAQDGTVLTSSRRLARELRHAWDRQQLAAGRQSWPTPDIRHWQDWFAERIGSARDSGLPLLIDNAAATLLWEQSLDATSREDLLSISGVVRHAQAARSRLADWQVPADAVAAAAASRDEHWFVRAASRYEARLEDRHWIDAPALAALCLSKVDTLTWPARIVHAGFDRVSPALGALFDGLRAHGTDVSAAPERAGTPAQHAVTFADADSQWRAAGRWARERLQQAPEQRIAIVVPDLESDAGRVARLVREGFAPGWQLGDAGWRDSVNVSYGQRLSAYPAIASALAWLRFAADGLDGTGISRLLRTPFAETGERGEQARLERRLREYPDRRWSPPALVALFAGRDECGWCQRVEGLLPLYERRDERRAPSAWAEALHAALDELRWPGIAAAESETYQLVHRWQELLNELARLDRVLPSVSLRDAVSRLEQIATDAVFQAEGADGALDVMGLLETAGHEFDAVWLGNMDATRWPPAGSPLALVNRALQQERGMPDARPADTLAFAERAVARLRASCSELHVSRARTDGDNELVASPLEGLGGDGPAADTDDPGWFATPLAGKGRRHRIDIDPVPAIRGDERIVGGAYTVQRMREEPFAAFATGRLAADALERFEPGLSPRVRGNIVHDALHRLLRDKPGRDALRDWADLDTRVGKAAWQACRRAASHADPVLERLLALEQQRLGIMLKEFIDAERARDAFAIVDLEKQCQLRRGDVTLELRMDRIDRLADGRLLLIDYKTGAAKKLLNQDLTLKSVQMSVYASAVSEPVGALAFFNIDRRAIAYDGAGGGFTSGRMRIRDEQWDALLTDWCNEVDILLARFAAGEAGVNALQPADKARPLALLNRVAELRQHD